MDRFQFATAGSILFGRGVLTEGVEAAANWGRKALVLTGRDLSRPDKICELLEARGVSCHRIRITGEPTVEGIETILKNIGGKAWDFAVAFGGGSVLDGAKAVAALLANDGPILDYLEVIGRGKPLANPSLPLMAVPTTAGTGAEATRNAVLACPRHRVKVSLRSPFMLPRLAVVDPELTLSMPPPVTAGTGLDALTQLMETLVSSKANPMTDALCREGLRRGSRALERAWLDGEDLAAREDMAFASLMGGIGLANAGLGAVHGFAGPIGGMFSAPHGMVCAAILPHVMAANLQALAERQSESKALDRYREVAVLLTGDSDAQPEDGLHWMRALCGRLKVPSLSDFGLKSRDIPGIVHRAERASSMKGNPVRLHRDVLAEVLEAAI